MLCYTTPCHTILKVFPADLSTPEGVDALADFGKGDDTVGNPHRAQISQFELFELILLLKLDKQLPVEQLEATASQSTVLSLPLRTSCCRGAAATSWSTTPGACPRGTPRRATWTTGTGSAPAKRALSPAGT